MKVNDLGKLRTWLKDLQYLVGDNIKFDSTDSDEILAFRQGIILALREVLSKYPEET